MFHSFPVAEGELQFDLDFEKAKAALLYMASLKTPKFDQYKACKLLFLADKRHLVRYGRTITGDHYAALEWGPIPSNIRDELKRLIEENAGRLKDVFDVDRNYAHPRLIPKQKVDKSVLSKSDIETIRQIIKEFGPKSFDELKAITHETAAFKKVWKPTESLKSFPMKFVDFFEEDEDAVAGVLEEAIENYTLKKSFA
jgi:uncharacterized phage-associated protein